MQVINNIYYALLENADFYGIFLLMFLAVFMMVLAIAFMIKGRQSSTKERLGKLVGRGISRTGGGPALNWQARRDPGCGPPMGNRSCRRPVVTRPGLDRRDLRNHPLFNAAPVG